MWTMNDLITWNALVNIFVKPYYSIVLVFEYIYYLHCLKIFCYVALLRMHCEMRNKGPIKIISDLWVFVSYVL